MKISVLFGTETGTAEMVAEDLQRHLLVMNDVKLANLEDVDPDELNGDEFYLVVCSTFGDGELPATAQPFAARLKKQQPDLSAVRFGIFGMGDSGYEATFNFGPKTLAEMLTDAGAKQIGERAMHDASGRERPEDEVIPWAEKVLAEAAPLFAD
ncbi:MAG: flavodoxin domain-containing protein [Pseudomonadota bacterium]